MLQNNPVEPEAELFVELEFVMYVAVMNEDTDQETNIDKNDFDNVLHKFKLKNKQAYHFITKAGTGFQNSMYKLCKRFIYEEHFPEVFSETTLKQLWKRKGKREILDNHRYIHLKEWKPRLTEMLVTEMMKEDILKSGTKFQIGGVPGHTIEEHLIVLKTVIQDRIRRKEGVVVQLVDYKKFFDSERLRAIMASLIHANVNKKAYTCWFRMKKTTVRRPQYTR